MNIYMNILNEHLYKHIYLYDDSDKNLGDVEHLDEYVYIHMNVHMKNRMNVQISKLFMFSCKQNIEVGLSLVTETSTHLH